MSNALAEPGGSSTGWKIRLADRLQPALAGARGCYVSESPFAAREGSTAEGRRLRDDLRHQPEYRTRRMRPCSTRDITPRPGARIILPHHMFHGFMPAGRRRPPQGAAVSEVTLPDYCRPPIHRAAGRPRGGTVSCCTEPSAPASTGAGAHRRGWRVVGWDARVTGLSRLPRQLTIDHCARALAPLLEKMRNAVAGHSMGGMIAPAGSAPRAAAHPRLPAVITSAFGSPDGDWQKEFVVRVGRWTSSQHPRTTRAEMLRAMIYAWRVRASRGPGHRHRQPDARGPPFSAAAGGGHHF